MQEEKPSYYAILPACVRYDEHLKPNEKLLYSEITALASKTGICYASNKYFADLYKVENETVSRWIKHLGELNYISTEIIYKNDTKEIDKRIIKINGTPIDEKVGTYIPNNQEGYCENSQEGIDKKVKENNTSINNTSMNNKENIKRKFIPPTLEEIEAYCRDRNNNVDAKKFFDYYSVSDWKDKDGKPVKNWKQKIITWEGSRNKNTSKEESADDRAKRILGNN